MSLEKVYSPSAVESRWYTTWERSGLFHSTVSHERTPYTIVIPPPNITGVLHMGHILNNTLQDAFIRHKRMAGFEACWIPGTDHAGIATQNVVERSLIKEGKSRHDLGRERFVERVWKWREQYGGTIIRQLRSLGCSCDWEREKFTMDDSLSAAVREVFVRLYEEGLIYRGKYIVNWCPKDHTAISDDEVTYSEQQGKLYYIKYRIKGGRGASRELTVATTRPETMLGDTAIAVHPSDARYKKLIGRTAVVPLADREIPIIADDFVDPEFGTGLVKVTPAHDPNDFEIGRRHGLPQMIIFDPSARMSNEVPEPYRGLDRYEARRLILQDLEDLHLLAKVEDHTNNVGRCYRCDTVIEPYLSDQWFVKMQPLAEPALQVVTNGTIRFYPERWTRVYEHWMTNIRDWCISRQLWWGHRIPVWYCRSEAGCTEPIVSRQTPERCPRCGGTELHQDDDVLDTWFSSWLWPFSVHNWPEQERLGTAEDLRYYYPTNTLVTAPEIIFFWVARMIMAGLKFGPEFTGTSGPEANIPFRDVYFTSIVRDETGRKMSKSLGNSPEPLELIAEYGADAVRFTTLYLAPLGQDILYAPAKNEIGRNFANKIWNAARFLLMNREQLGTAPAEEGITGEHQDLADRWILSRLNSAATEIAAAFDAYEINKVSKTVYDFFWHDYCDWYLEMIKSRLYGEEAADVKQAVLNRAIEVFDHALRLLHPLMPFITEELWQNLRLRPEGSSIMRAPYPAADPQLIDARTEAEMGFVQRAIEALRNIRGEVGIAPSQEVTLAVKISDTRSVESIQRYAGYFERLARVTELRFLSAGADRPRPSASAVVEQEELFVPLAGVIDIERERTRLRKEIDRVTKMVEGVANKLRNQGFLDKAPREVIDRERQKLEHFTQTLEKLEHHYQDLQ